jgi:hypothetical protein
MMNNRKSIFGVIIAVVLITTTTIINAIPAMLQLADGKAFLPSNFDAPIAISGDNVYITWWSNKTGGNHEVLFRASNDGGETFSDKINFSNTTGAESVDAEIAAEGANVIVTWWERNETANEPVMRVSNDNGQTFRPVLNLAANGTIDATIAANTITNTTTAPEEEGEAE